jgi:tRNA-2-methylthio-N6-dimethylallyladenosine synthase
MIQRAYVETWGCQMNHRQSEGIAGILSDAGYRIVSSLDDADVVVFNGCMVRQKAEEKVFGRLGAVAEQKRRRPVLLGIGGCMGQVHGERLLQRSEIVDFVFGTGGHTSLPRWIDQARSERLAVRSEPVFSENEPCLRTGRVSAMVTLTEGCSNHCAYCIVPHARGPLRCRPPEQILSEVEDLQRSGYKEVLLLGQNVNAYRSTRPGVLSFAELLSTLARTGIQRIRFTTSHPKDLAEDTLQVMAREESVCPHLHLACQSGSDRVLEAMGRGYDRRRYLELVTQARQMIPTLNVTTDVIVGFPGETEDEFAKTLALLEEVRFGSVFAAKYSPRPHTRAMLLLDEVPPAVKADRLERLLALQRAVASQENARWVGQEVAVLVEGQVREGTVYGRAPDHRTVVGEGCAVPGETVAVRIDASSASSLSGSILCMERSGGAR